MTVRDDRIRAPLNLTLYEELQPTPSQLQRVSYHNILAAIVLAHRLSHTCSPCVWRCFERFSNCKDECDIYWVNSPVKSDLNLNTSSEEKKNQILQPQWNILLVQFGDLINLLTLKLIKLSNGQPYIPFQEEIPCGSCMVSHRVQ